MTARLTCFGESGNAYKAALTLTLCGIDWEPRWIDFFHGASFAPEFREANVMGEAPVLEADGMRLSQSGAIQLWAAERTGRYLAPDRYEALRWVFFDNHKVSSQAGALRYHMNFLAPEKRSQTVIDWLAARLNSAYKVMDAQLARTPFLGGDEPSIGDLACCGYLFYPEDFRWDRRAFPNVDAWLSRIEALPGWRHPYDLLPRREGLSPSLGPLTGATP